MKKALILLLVLLCGCTTQNYPIKDRLASVANMTKMTPTLDIHPPVLLSTEYEEPVPLPYPVSTPGGEDSPFIPIDEENALYFFFTPNVSVPVERQLFDGVTGIYVTHLVNGVWSEPERLLLQDAGRLAGDGCEFVQNNTIWFCSVREGYSGINWFTAEYKNGKWNNWTIADFNPSYEVGELHFSKDLNTLYYHSSRPGGLGGLDIWMILRNPDGTWSEPENVRAVNSERNEGWPALSPDGDELWISKDYGLWRSILVNKTWSTPEQIISTLAGEAAIDSDGNVYFVHHYYKDDVMLEGDIYVAYKK